MGSQGRNGRDVHGQHHRKAVQHGHRGACRGRDPISRRSNDLHRPQLSLACKEGGYRVADCARFGLAIPGPLVAIGSGRLVRRRHNLGPQIVRCQRAGGNQLEIGQRQGKRSLGGAGIIVITGTVVIAGTVVITEVVVIAGTVIVADTVVVIAGTVVITGVVVAGLGITGVVVICARTTSQHCDGAAREHEAEQQGKQVLHEPPLRACSGLFATGRIVTAYR